MNKKALFGAVIAAALIGSIQAEDVKPVNLAQGAKATAIQVQGNKSQFQASSAVDGDFKTRWASGLRRPPVWIMLDFETAKTFKTIRLFWAAYATAYDLEISDDGKVWKSIYTEKNSNGKLENIVLEQSVTSRYFRILCRKPATGWGYSLWEIQIFEK